MNAHGAVILVELLSECCSEYNRYNQVLISRANRRKRELKIVSVPTLKLLIIA